MKNRKAGAKPGRGAPPRPGAADGHGMPADLLAALLERVNRGQFAEAVAEAERLTPQYPHAFLLWTILGAAAAQIGKTEQAIAGYTRACAINPGFADGHYNLGVLYQAQDRFEAAAACYRQTLSIEPDHADAHNSLGTVLQAQGELAQAAESHARALARNPGFAEAHYNLGIVFKAQGKLEEAAGCYRRSLSLRPDFAEAHTNLAVVLRDQGQLDAAIASYRQALACKPDHALAEADMLYQQMHICDWREHHALEAACARLAAHKDAPPTGMLLAMVDDAGMHLRFSRKWAAAKFRLPSQPLPTRPAERPKRLRIGYFSADFYDHATLFLMAGLLREHDKARFEVYAYNYGSAAPGEWGQRAQQQVDRFVDVADQPARAIADLARSHALDIAIDLKGYTMQGRADLFQHRLAPVQISYLGYPGSMGADFIDYLVADPVVIPPDQRAHYSERVIALPHSYQPNDNARPIAASTASRADFGLPESGFVLCCFNSPYKISPREFAIWMRVLGQIDGSVLWLLKTNTWCEANLRREAAARGIAPERLVFAEPMHHADHLARHRHADLFVDCFHVNAHTTASDALWAGLPVVTRAGRQFAARVSASLLSALGLPDLVTTSDAHYEALILALASDPAKLAAIRARLAANRLDHPLFDTRLYTRHFEAGLEAAYDRYFAGLPPEDIAVPAQP